MSIKYLKAPSPVFHVMCHRALTTAFKLENVIITPDAMYTHTQTRAHTDTYVHRHTHTGL